MSDQPQYALVGYADARQVKQWLDDHSRTHLWLTQYYGPHRVAVFMLPGGVDMAYRGETPQIAGSEPERQAGDAVRPLEAHPELPQVLFDGYSVYSALDDQARRRTSPENVSDVLDAVVRLILAPSLPPLCPRSPTTPTGESHE